MLALLNLIYTCRDTKRSMKNFAKEKKPGASTMVETQGLGVVMGQRRMASLSIASAVASGPAPGPCNEYSP